MDVLTAPRVASYEDLRKGQWIALLNRDDDDSIDCGNVCQVSGQAVQGSAPAGDYMQVYDPDLGHLRVTRGMCERGDVFILVD